MSALFEVPLVGEVMVNREPQPCYVLGINAHGGAIVVITSGPMQRQIRHESLGAVLIDVEHLAERVRVVQDGGTLPANVYRDGLGRPVDPNTLVAPGDR